VKVLHILKTATGASWAYEQMCVLRSLGVDVHVVLPARVGSMAPRYRAAGIDVIEADLDFPLEEPWKLPGVLRSCRRVVGQVNPDLIHTDFVGTILVLRLALGEDSAIPRVFGVTGTLHLEHDFFAWLDTGLAGPQDYWIATCKWTQRKYQELGIPPERVFLAYLGTDTSRYSTSRTGVLRAQLGIAEDVPLVGMVSLIYPPKWFLGATRGHKGHEDFIRAFARLHARRPEVRGVLIGGLWGKGQWYEERIRYLAQAPNQGNLSFVGTRTDLREIYPDLDLAVVPSYSDGLAYSVAEPLLSEVPVVATSVGGLTDVVRDGETGWLVPPGNIQALSNAMEDAIRQPIEAKRRARKGKELVTKILNLRETGIAVLTAYRTILARSTALARGTANEISSMNVAPAVAEALRKKAEACHRILEC
jgi:glycosyltransferase involved in cell wall biosynthesis